MFVRQLSYLVALAREKHFGRAAERCNVTQSTLSSAIKRLESELDLPLVVRGHRFLGLTAEGQRVVDWAHQIISDYDSLRQDIDGLRGGLQGTLRLGVIPAAMPTVAFLTQPFYAKHPKVTVDVRSMTSIAIQRGLDEFELDAGMTYLENEPLVNVRRKSLYRERYLFITNTNGRHAHRRSITWREAVGEELCLLTEDMQNRRVLNALVGSMSMTLTPTVVTNSFLGVCSHVSRGPWSSIVPHTFGCIFADCREIRMVELIEPVHSQAVGLVVSDRDPLAPLAKEFMAGAARLVLHEQLGESGPAVARLIDAVNGMTTYSHLTREPARQIADGAEAPHRSKKRNGRAQARKRRRPS